jgi:hypothetical protein
MKLVALKNIFDIRYGNQFDLNKLESNEDSDINFVSRTSQNLGVVCKVSKHNGVEPFSSGLITVTLGGTYLLSSFVQQEKFYTAQNIKILTPKIELSFNEKVYYCLVIQMNRFRYSSHGREANKTLDDLLVPEEVPDIFRSIDFNKVKVINKKSLSKGFIQLNPLVWSWFDLDELFDVSASRDELIENLTLGNKTPYIASTEFNNGIIEFVDEQPTNKAGTITANRGGSVGHFFYQPKDYLATPVDVRILTPKFVINEYIGLFITTILKLEKYKFNYSRKMGTDRLKKLKIKLPSKNGQPDFEFMENYIKSLPYSSSI